MKTHKHELIAINSIDSSELLAVCGGIQVQQGQSFRRNYTVGERQEVQANLSIAGFDLMDIEGYRDQRT